MEPRIGPAGRIGRFFLESKLTPLIVLGSMALGVFAVVLTPREEEPQIVVPMADVFVGLPGASPLEVENRVTIPLEKKLWELPGVEYVYSASMPGLSLVTVRFYVGEDLERSLVRLHDKLVGSVDQSPHGATMPLVKLRTIDDVPVLALTLWSERYDGFEMRRIAAELARALARVPEVSDIRLSGGQRRQLRVLLDSERMAAFGVDPARIATALSMQNAAGPAGRFEQADREVLVETGGWLDRVDDVRDLVVGVHDARPVYVRDVADVLDGPEDPVEYVFFSPGAAFEADGADAAGSDLLSEAVTISIAKRTGSDAHRVVRDLMRQVETLRGGLIPDDLRITVTRDYGETANEKAGELLVHLIGAIVSVTIVIAIFLGWRGGLVVFVSVPVTFALTLFVYYLSGYTLNRVTLFALIFVTGIVVDDSIIVVENIVRHFAMGTRTAREAAVAAVDEVGNPTILATLTVIAAVLPMAFVRGLMGPYMRPMPVGAAMAMVFSLAIALIAAPWFSYRLLRGAHRSGGHAEGREVDRTLTYRVYRRLLEPLLRRASLRWVFLGVVFLLLAGAVSLVPLKLVTVKMLPFDNKSEVQVIVDMPEGSTLERTTAVAREIGDHLRTLPQVTHLQIYAGTAAPINFNGLVRHYDLRRGPNVADLQVNLVHKSERRVKSHDFAKRIRGPIAAIAERHGAAVKIAEVPPGPPVLATLVAEVYGPTHEARLELARNVRDVFASTDGVVDVDWVVEAAQPKLVFEVDREKAALHGVPAAGIARTLRLALTGEEIGLLHDANEVEPVPIRLQLPRERRSSVADLERLRVASLDGTLVPLSELVEVEETTEPVARYRKNLAPVIYVTGDVAGTQESPVYAILDLAERIDALAEDGGPQVVQLFRAAPGSDERLGLKWDGEWQISYEVFRDLGIAFGVVLLLIYLLIVAWFGSFKVPLVMMIAIPLSLVGILPAHWIFGAFFTATSMIGFIALAGIMVRNSVLLIDFVDQALSDGHPLGEAVVEAGAVRLRPILLTAGTVVVGALVILFDPIFEGLAISLMSGAAASTVLTLLVVPLVYFMATRRSHAAPAPDPGSRKA